MAFHSGKMVPLRETSKPEHPMSLRIPTANRVALLVGLPLGAVLLTVAAQAQESPIELIERAEVLWQRRAEDSTGPRADPDRARQLVAAWQDALDSRPQDLELQWKLLRALHFQGDYGLAEGVSRLEHYERARAIADAAREQLQVRTGTPLADLEPAEIAATLGDVPEATPIYLYSAVHWGRWGENTGKMKAARQGVAGKLRGFAEVVILLDERFDGAGGHRFLGRMHTEAPRIPFVTGWIDRAQAVLELERAVELAPDDRYNKLFLADALLRFEPERRDEALELLREIIERAPRAERLVEDRAAAADALTLRAAANR